MKISFCDFSLEMSLSQFTLNMNSIIERNGELILIFVDKNFKDYWGRSGRFSFEEICFTTWVWTFTLIFNFFTLEDCLIDQQCPAQLRMLTSLASFSWSQPGHCCAGLGWVGLQWQYTTLSSLLYSPLLLRSTACPGNITLHCPDC